MNTKINLTYNGIDYTLEYNRMTIKMIESEGFMLSSFENQPMNMIGLAFKGAFYKNHRKIPQSLIDEIYAHCPDKEGLINQIITMITECYSSLTDEPEGDEGNVTWEVVNLSPKIENL